MQFVPDKPFVAEAPAWSYVSYLLKKEQDGVGVMGIFACDDEDMRSKARTFGLSIACEPEPASGNSIGTHVAFLTDDPAPDTILAFYRAALEKGWITWEDEAGVSVFDELGLE